MLEQDITIYVILFVKYIAYLTTLLFEISEHVILIMCHCKARHKCIGKSVLLPAFLIFAELQLFFNIRLMFPSTFIWLYRLFLNTYYQRSNSIHTLYKLKKCCEQHGKMAHTTTNTWNGTKHAEQQDVRVTVI